MSRLLLKLLVMTKEKRQSNCFYVPEICFFITPSVFYEPHAFSLTCSVKWVTQNSHLVTADSIILDDITAKTSTSTLKLVACQNSD